MIYSIRVIAEQDLNEKLNNQDGILTANLWYRSGFLRRPQTFE